MWYNYIFAFGLIIMLLCVIAYFAVNYVTKKAYQAEFKNLQIDVEFTIINYENYKLIRQKFEDIRKFSCVDKKKLAELKMAFEDRFEVIFTPEIDEHSPEMFDFQNLQRQVNINNIINQNDAE